MKKHTILIISATFLLLTLFSCSISAQTVSSGKDKIIRSFVSEDAAFNAISLDYTDVVKVKNEKGSFTLDDKKVTWSGCVRGGLGSHDYSNYSVCWYAPDGMVCEKQTPKALFMDCSGLKSSLTIDKEKFGSKTGLWKIEVTYKDGLIDNKYFYLTITGIKEITQDEINSLEERIAKNKPVMEVKKVEIEKSEVKNTEEKQDDIPASYAIAPAESVKYDENLSALQPKILSEKLLKLEGEVIGECNKIEDLLEKRGKFYEDEKVYTYLNGIEKKIASDMAAGANINTKVKVVRDPTVNAFSLANGSIHVTTGTLARLNNEAQLVFILAHETSHLINKDMTYRADSTHNKTIAYKLFDIGLAPTSVFFGVLGDLTQIGFGLLYASSVTGYGRNIEARADMDSIPSTVKEGYNPHEAMSTIEVLLNERERYQKGIEVFFLMDHPTNEWRIEKLNKLIAKKYGAGKEGFVGSDEFLNTMYTVKLYNATLNIKLDRLEHARDNIQWVLEKFPDSPVAHYLAGEIYRLEAEDKRRVKDELATKKWTELTKGYKDGELEEVWYKKAMEEYNKAIEYDPNYANSYKGLALAYNNKKDKDKTLQNLQKYLELAPNAEDKRYITSLITRLNKAVEEKKK